MRNLIWGIILVVFGGMLLLNNLGVADFEDLFKDYWPILLILWGLLILNRKREQQATSANEHYNSTYTNDSTRSVSNDTLRESNIFGSIFIANTSKDFKGGSVSSTFGDCFVDLSKSSFAEGEHILQVHSAFGKTTIVLPKDAAVLISASSTFGNLTILNEYKSGISSSIDTKSPTFDTSPRKMKIYITQVFGNARVS